MPAQLDTNPHVTELTYVLVSVPLISKGTYFSDLLFSESYWAIEMSFLSSSVTSVNITGYISGIFTPCVIYD